MTHLCLFLPQLLVLTSCRECGGSYGSKPGTGARHTECPQGQKEPATNQHSPPNPHLSRTPAPSTLWEATALSGQMSVLGKELMVFTFSSFLEWFLIQRPILRGVGTPGGTRSSPAPGTGALGSKMCRDRCTTELYGQNGLYQGFSMQKWNMTQNPDGTEAAAKARAPSCLCPKGLQTSPISIFLFLPGCAKFELSHAIPLQCHVECLEEARANGRQT